MLKQSQLKHYKLLELVYIRNCWWCRFERRQHVTWILIESFGSSPFCRSPGGITGGCSCRATSGEGTRIVGDKVEWLGTRKEYQYLLGACGSGGVYDIVYAIRADSSNEVVVGRENTLSQDNAHRQPAAQIRWRVAYRVWTRDCSRFRQLLCASWECRSC
jgi:hypothetical protein